MDTVQWDSGKENGAICYARSSDGIRWEKPELGLVAYQLEPRLLLQRKLHRLQSR